MRKSMLTHQSGNSMATTGQRHAASSSLNQRPSNALLAGKRSGGNFAQAPSLEEKRARTSGRGMFRAGRDERSSEADSQVGDDMGHFVAQMAQRQSALENETEDQVLNLINKVQMFKIATDKVNKQHMVHSKDPIFKLA